MAPFMSKVFEGSKLKNITYVEPYAGGAGAALALLFTNKVKRIVINDLDKSIYSFWKSVVNDPKKFIRKIYSTPVTINEWKKQKLIYKNPDSKQFALGFATFYLNRTNISGILDGGPIGGLKQKGEWKINARFNKKGLAKRIRQLSCYQSRISIFNEDGLELIDQYLNKQNAFIYLDPPYYGKGATLYMNHYIKKDHEALARKLNGNSNALWLLTYDNKAKIRSLFQKRKNVNYSLKYNAYKSRLGKELIILSDPLANSIDKLEDMPNIIGRARL